MGFISNINLINLDQKNLSEYETNHDLQDDVFHWYPYQRIMYKVTSNGELEKFWYEIEDHHSFHSQSINLYNFEIVNPQGQASKSFHNFSRVSDYKLRDCKLLII